MDSLITWSSTSPAWYGVFAAGCSMAAAAQAPATATSPVQIA
jgi:hypothetical protein